MCTLSVVTRGAASGGSAGGLVRIVFNRDEERTRASALAPEPRRCGDRVAIMPIDAVSNGTWIAVNDAGVAACLLNATGRPPGPRAGGGVRSRGEIVPAVMTASGFDHARKLAEAVDCTAFPSFRLLVIAEGCFAEFGSERTHPVLLSSGLLRDPLMLASSGLGDELVQTPRRAVFARCMVSGPDVLTAQEQFHRERDDARGELGVLMSRQDARTVSRTTIDLAESRAVLSYEPLDDRLHASGISVLELSVRMSAQAARA